MESHANEQTNEPHLSPDPPANDGSTDTRTLTNGPSLHFSLTPLREIRDDIDRTTKRHVVTITLEDCRTEQEIVELYEIFENLYGPVFDWPSCVFDAQDHAGVVKIAREQTTWAKEHEMRFRLSSNHQHIDNSVDVQFSFERLTDAVHFKLRWG